MQGKNFPRMPQGDWGIYEVGEKICTSWYFTFILEGQIVAYILVFYPFIGGGRLFVFGEKLKQAAETRSLIHSTNKQV